MKTKFFLSSMLFAVLSLASLAMVSCDKDDNVKAPTLLKFNPNNTEVAVGKTATVSVKGGTAPYTANSKDAEIATASTKDATITIKGVKAGKTTITVTDKNKKSGTISVTVK